MHSNVIIGVIVALLIAGGLWFVLLREEAAAPAITEEGGEMQTSKTVESSQTAEIAETFSGSGSFLELMGMGRNLECDFSYVADETGGAVAGTVKLSGERMRGDFEMEQGGQVYSSSMIQTDDTIYTWSQSAEGTFAIKLPREEVDDMGGSDDVGEFDRTVDMDADVEYDCHSWNVDSSVFVPPSDLEFMSPEEMMQNLMQGFDPSAYMQ